MLYFVHLGVTKMYQDLKKRGQARGKVPYVQQVKAEHQRPAGTLQPLEIPEWK